MMTTAGPSDPFITRTSGHRGRVVAWEGHIVVELESAQLAVRVSLTRGAEVLELRSKEIDADLLWHGHDDVLRNRPAIPTRQLPQGNFVEHFAGGWQEVLPNAQFPVNYHGAVLGQHGEAALLSWDYRVVADEPDHISVEFSVELRRVPLRLTRRMTLTKGRLDLVERVENLGAIPIEFQWGHHIALGGVTVEAGTRIDLPSGTPVTVPTDPSPSYRFAAGSSSWPTAHARDGLEIDVQELPADDATEGHLILGPLENGQLTLTNDSAGLTVAFSWDHTMFPYCWIWMVLRGNLEWPLWGRHRLVTVEPFSSPLISLDEARETNTALVVDPGATADAWISVDVSRPTQGAI